MWSGIDTVDKVPDLQILVNWILVSLVHPSIISRTYMDQMFYLYKSALLENDIGLTSSFCTGLPYLYIHDHKPGLRTGLAWKATGHGCPPVTS